MKFLLSVLIFICVHASAYIPPTRMILDKVSDNSGKSGYEIVKEVRINSSVPITFREVWQIENERTLKVSVTPVDSPSASLHILYVGGQKIVLTEKGRETTKMPAELTERIFHFRTMENLAAYLSNLQILTHSTGHLDLARLNRAQGVVNYGLGKKSDSESSSIHPYLWIEQDRFVIRKLRYESGVELTADQFVVHPKGLTHPEVMNLTWNKKSARIKTLSVTAKKWTPQSFQPNSVQSSQSFLQSSMTDPLVQEFYTRFR
ncbi:MAG: hypothetical protein ACK5V3_04285 [Bdellovibrionales bacterium]